jgi:hypothetical protein
VESERAGEPFSRRELRLVDETQIGETQDVCGVWGERENDLAKIDREGWVM